MSGSGGYRDELEARRARVEVLEERVRELESKHEDAELARREVESLRHALEQEKAHAAELEAKFGLHTAPPSAAPIRRRPGTQSSLTTGTEELGCLTTLVRLLVRVLVAVLFSGSLSGFILGAITWIGVTIQGPDSLARDSLAPAPLTLGSLLGLGLSLLLLRVPWIGSMVTRTR